MKNIHTILAITLTALSVSCAYAVDDPAASDKAKTNAAEKAVSDAKATAAKLPMTKGEIKKIDKENGKITIKHGEIKNLDMPPMTMVFRVQNPALLDAAKAGDKINFAAEKINGNFTVTKIEAVK